MNPMQIMSMLSQFKKNPMSILSQRFNLPQNIPAIRAWQRMS